MFDLAQTTNRGDTFDLKHEDRIIYGIRSVKDMIADASAPQGSAQTVYTYGGISLTRCVWLPPENVALALFQEYIDSIGSVYHVLHRPTTNKLIKDTYVHLIQRQTLNPAHLALLLSIVATGAYFWNQTTSAHRYLFTNQNEAMESSLIWLKWTLDVTENNRRTIYGSIEDCQATIIVAHLITNLEGFSARTRFLYSTILNMAWDLQLHTVDSPRHRKINDAPSGHILKETKRRLWWYIAVSDW